MLLICFGFCFVFANLWSDFNCIVVTLFINNNLPITEIIPNLFHLYLFENVMFIGAKIYLCTPKKNVWRGFDKMFFFPMYKNTWKNPNTQWYWPANIWKIEICGCMRGILYQNEFWWLLVFCCCDSSNGMTLFINQLKWSVSSSC